MEKYTIADFVRQNPDNKKLVESEMKLHLEEISNRKNNKLIAEFMGGIISSVSNLINLPQNRGDANIHSVKGSEMLPNGTYSVHRLNELKYHTSWDWLMPVTEKCLVTNEHTDGHHYYINDALLTCNIDVVYDRVVEFIKEHNKTI